MPSIADLLSGKKAIPLAPRAIWKCTGSDRVRFLNGQVTNDVTKLTPGHARHAAVTNAKGRMDGDVWITATSDALWVDAPAELGETLGPRIDRYLIADDVLMEDVSDAWSLYHVLGVPQAAEGIQSARFFIPGHDLWLPSGSRPEIPLADEETIEVLRVHQGVPLWGRDMGPQTLPPEAAFERDAISYSKGCYIGQEVIARIKSVGRVNKRLARFHTECHSFPPLPSDVHIEDKVVGQLSSVTSAPEGTGLIGLGTLARDPAEAGGPCQIAGNLWTIISL